MKYTYVIPIFGLGAVAAGCTSAGKKAVQKPYNIVYIMTDDHTAQMMSCYDQRYAETPNLISIMISMCGNCMICRSNTTIRCVSDRIRIKNRRNEGFVSLL